MPWTAETFRSKHNHRLTDAQAKRAAKIANAHLAKTGNEGAAIRIANAAVGRAKSSAGSRPAQATKRGQR